MYLIAKDVTYKNQFNDLAKYDFKIPLACNGIVLFIHGYKGFKDWGAWNLMQEYFVENNLGFVKFNMTHNGVGLKDLGNFTELAKFSENTYSLEVEDTRAMNKEVKKLITENFNVKLPIYLLGHSRGGGIAILLGKESVSKVATLAAICDIERRFPIGEKLDKWIEEGIYYVLNTRTNQEMPHKTNIYFDFLANKEKLNILEAANLLGNNLMVIHGNNDEAVNVEEAYELVKSSKANISIIENANHTFGATHPWLSEKLPEDLKNACDQIIEFFKKPTS